MSTRFARLNADTIMGGYVATVTTADYATAQALRRGVTIGDEHG